MIKIKRFNLKNANLVNQGWRFLYRYHSMSNQTITTIYKQSHPNDSSVFHFYNPIRALRKLIIVGNY